MTKPTFKFKIGDRAYKNAGNYQAWGTIRAVFLTRNQQTRVVFDFDELPGLLHIFTESQLLTEDEAHQLEERDHHEL